MARRKIRLPDQVQPSKPRGGYRKPYRILLLIRDVFNDLGETYSQRLSTELHHRIKKLHEADKSSKVHSLKLPSREAVLIYTHILRKLGLIQYTGQEEDAHHKDGTGATELAKAKYLKIVPGKENSSLWNRRITSLIAAASGKLLPVIKVPKRKKLLPKVTPEFIPVERPVTLKPKLKPKLLPKLKPVEVSKPTPKTIETDKKLKARFEAVYSKFPDIVTLARSLPGTQSVLTMEVDNLVTEVAKLVREAPEDSYISALSDQIEGVKTLVSKVSADIKRTGRHLVVDVRRIEQVLSGAREELIPGYGEEASQRPEPL